MMQGGGLPERYFVAYNVCMPQVYRGYIRIWNNQRRVWEYEHRLVMERHLGRKLEFSESVHHIDGDRSNNFLENLVVLRTGDHVSEHWANKARKACSVALCVRPHHAGGLCNTHYMAKARLGY